MKIKKTHLENFNPHRKPDKPKAIERNKGLFIALCLRDGLTLRKAHEAFERANRELWSNACS